MSNPAYRIRITYDVVYDYEVIGGGRGQVMLPAGREGEIYPFAVGDPRPAVMMDGPLPPRAVSAWGTLPATAIEPVNPDLLARALEPQPKRV